MFVIWGDGGVVEVDGGYAEQEALTGAEVEEIVEVLATSSKLPFVIERLSDLIREHRQAGRPQAAINAAVVLAAMVGRIRPITH
jgi:hypothetical protein